MNISTITKLTFRTTSLGALALTILAASANSSFAQIPYSDTLPALALSPYIIPEPPITVGGPDWMTVNITNAKFLGAAFEIDMIETSGQFTGHISDRILFDNTGTGGPGNTALITFLSDDEFGNLPTADLNGTVFPFYSGATSVPDGLFGPISVLMADLLNNPYTLTATMISGDGELGTTNPFLPQGASDLLALSAVPTPEPSTVCLAGLGLAALAGIAYRRRRTGRTA
jgi:MYXO-CTERM domain-containing protein